MGKAFIEHHRQIMFRNFPGKMPGIAKGAVTSFLHCLSPQPPDGYLYKGRAFNGAELFTDGAGAYFFPKRIYEAGETLHVREEWAIQHGDDGTPVFAYKAGWGDNGPAQWKAASYMPLEAARFFLLVESTEICRISEVTAKDAKAMGAGGRSWRKDLEAMWDADLRKQELQTLGFARDPWVQIVRFRLVDRPDGWPTEINERILSHGTDYKSYTIRLAETGEVLAKGTATECAKSMGYKSNRRIYTLISHITSGINHKYTIEVTQEPRTPRPRNWLRGE